MYEGYEYATKYGVALVNEYPKYHGSTGKCKGHFVSHFFPSSEEEQDDLSVEELKQLVQK